MIRIAAASYAYVKEYLSDNQGTYLDSGQVMPPFSGGKMAKYFGLDGEYDRHAFLQSMDGKFRIDGSNSFSAVRYHASGEKADEEGKRDKMDPAIEVIVSPPKSWSAAIHFAKGEEKKMLQDLLASAMKAAMARMEDLATTRITVDKVTANEKVAGLNWMAFAHDSTRRGDMDHHFHMIVNKLTLGLDGKVRTLDLASVIRIQYEMDAYFKTELARLAAAAGYEIRMTQNGPELEQMDPRLLKVFSSARTEIEALLKDVGIDIEHATSNQKNWANAEKRLAKIQFNESFIEKLHREKLAAVGLNYDAIVVRAEREGYTLNAPRRAVEAVYMAMQDVHEREDVIKSRHHLMLLSAKYSDFSIPADELNEAIDQLIASNELMFRVEARNGRITAESVTMTSRFALEREQASIGYCRNAAGRGGPVTSIEAANDAIAAVEAKLQAGMKPDAKGVIKQAKLSQGQSDMVYAALGITHDSRITCVQGDPGTGKTTGMQAVLIAAEQAGWKVLGLAPSDKARDELSAVGVESETIQQATSGVQWWDKVDARTLIIIDESGMVDSRTMNAALEQAQAKGARLVAIGDIKQMLSVEAGTPFKLMCEQANDGPSFVKMTQMERARNDHMKQLHIFSRDDQAAAVRMIMAGGPAGKAAFFSKKEDQIEFIAERIASLSHEERLKTPVIVDRNKDRIQVTAEIRRRLGLETVFTMNTFDANQNLTRVSLLLASTYEEGDDIKMQRNNGPFKKGRIYSVEKIEKGRVFVKDSEGLVQEFVPHLHGRDATLGEQEKLSLGKGDLVRISAKWKEAGLRNGDRAIVREIDAAGRSVFDVVDMDGNVSSSVAVDLSKEGLSVRSGYATTVNGMQGASLDGGEQDGGYYLASSSNMNQWLVAITRFKNRLTLVSSATTQDSMHAMINRAQTPHIKDRALPTKAQLAEKLKPRGVNAAWAYNPDLNTQKVDFIPFLKTAGMKEPQLGTFLENAKKRFGTSKITGTQTFVDRCQEVAERRGIADDFIFAVTTKAKRGALKSKQTTQDAAAHDSITPPRAASVSGPRM